MMPIRGVISLPGDKSISHRALMLASLTEKDCIIHNISTGDDVETTRRCLAVCGVKSKKNGSTVFLKGGRLKTPKIALNCGNSGTTVRLLSGLLAGSGMTVKFTGDTSLSKRPMNRIIEPLTKMGVTIESQNGNLPISLSSEKLIGINYSSPNPSAQVKSCIILAGLGAFGVTKIHEINNLGSKHF